MHTGFLPNISHPVRGISTVYMALNNFLEVLSQIKKDYQYFVMRECIELLLILFNKRRTSVQELFCYWEVSTWLKLFNIPLRS